MESADDVKVALYDNIDDHVEILQEAYQASIVSLDVFQQWVLEKFQGLGISAGTFRVDSSELKTQPAFRKRYPDDSIIDKGPDNVFAQLNPEAGDGVLFFAHADKSPVSYEYVKKYPKLLNVGERFSGPGIADDVAGIAAMVSALQLYKILDCVPRKQILMASILGKEGGVFGSYGLMKRFGPLSSAVYLHPAESGGGLGELKIASNGLIEFSIAVEGKPPESTEVHQSIFSKSAVSAVQKAIFIYGKLKQWAEIQSDHYLHPAVETMAGQSFALSVGHFFSAPDTEVFEIPVSCTMAGTLCFPPNASLIKVREEFESELQQITASDAWLSDGHWRLEYGDRIAESGESHENSPFIMLSSKVVASLTGKKPTFFYGHSMSDIRYPLQHWQAQAFGIGPLSGDLGKETEWVDKKEYFLSILILVELMRCIAGSENN